VGREACAIPGISRSFQVLSRSATLRACSATVAARVVPFCYVLSRFSRRAREYGSRCVAFNHGASRRVTVYGPARYGVLRSTTVWRGARGLGGSIINLAGPGRRFIRVWAHYSYQYQYYQYYEYCITRRCGVLCCVLCCVVVCCVLLLCVVDIDFIYFKRFDNGDKPLVFHLEKKKKKSNSNNTIIQ